MRKLLAYIIILTFLSGCFPTRHLNDGEKLLVKTKISIEGKHQFKKSDLEEFIKQNPNRKILGYYRFHLALYNAVSQYKLEKKTAERKEKLAQKNKKIDEKNIKREAKGKKLKEYKDYKPHWREKWKNIIGEKPTIYDSLKTVSSLKQMNLFLFKKGYYDAVDTFHLKRPFLSKRKIKVVYDVYPDTAYVIQKMDYLINNPNIKLHLDLLKETGKLEIKENKPIDIDILDKEREIITEQLNNSGYYEFNKEYLTYQIDTNQVEHSAHVKLFLNRSKTRDLFEDTITLSEHKLFKISTIGVNIYGGSEAFDVPKKEQIDGLNLNYYNSEIVLNPEEISRSFLFEKGELYNLKKITQTRKRLVNSGLYENIQILFEKENSSDSLLIHKLKCIINLTLIKKQTLQAESNGTHTNGNYGIEGSLSYVNRNLFKGGEKLEFSVSGGLQTQRSLASEDDSELTEIDAIKRTLNTFQIGPQLEFSIPRLLFFSNKFKNIDFSQTLIHADLNWQITPDYNRQVEEILFAYNLRKGNHAFTLNPIEISFVEIDITNEEFQKNIDSSSDPFLRNSFLSHVNTGSKIRYQFTNKKKKSAFFLNTSLEGVGNMLKYAYNFIGVDENANGNHEFLGIEFAQFVKAQSEIIYHYNISKSNDLAFRFNSGIGVPFHNSNYALPFEKSFYIGGPNSLRAWKTRTLGPGGYFSGEKTFDKIGDIILEANAEYRFELLSSFESALFIDAGNIWMYDKNTGRTDGNFALDSFVEQIALGAGIGFRFDLSYFLLRFDLAIPLKTPYLSEGERWIFQPHSLEGNHFSPQLNFGIGYPF